MSRCQNTRRDFIKMASTAVVSGAIASTARSEPRAALKVLNHNPSMNYRRLGKTEFMISEIALGGHGAHGYDERAVQNRIPVLERAVELGMNYVDTVGMIGMKAFGAGSVFGPRSRRRREFRSAADGRAHVLLKKMLQEKRLSSIIPGVNVPEHLAENVKACQEPEEPARAEEDQAIRQCQENFYANLAPQYQWLRKWEVA